jgi:hypothetical protein
MSVVPIDQVAVVTLALALCGLLFNAGSAWQRLNRHERDIDEIAVLVREFHTKVDEIKGMIRGDDQ